MICKMYINCLVTKLCLTLFDPMDHTVAHQAPLSMGFPRKEYWSGCHFLLQCINKDILKSKAYSNAFNMLPFKGKSMKPKVGQKRLNLFFYFRFLIICVNNLMY